MSASHPSPGTPPRRRLVELFLEHATAALGDELGQRLAEVMVARVQQLRGAPEDEERGDPSRVVVLQYLRAAGRRSAPGFSAFSGSQVRGWAVRETARLPPASARALVQACASRVQPASPDAVADQLVGFWAAQKLGITAEEIARGLA